MYHVVFSERALKEFKKFDTYTQKMIFLWINKNLDGSENPRSSGKALSSNRAGQWRYRIGDYRMICEINDNELIILTLSIGHRSIIYK